jgi:hypothetical protein
MPKTLTLATDLALPISAVTEKLAWLGRTGSGKSYGAMKLAELMLEAGAQIGALDPVGVWRALRVPAAKDGRAFEVVVFGGLYGDVPLEPGAGKLIADLVVDRGLSFVIDVSQFIPSEQQTFAAAFAHQFFHRKKSAPSAVHLFIEECQEFIPENPSGREALTLGEFQRLWKLGRNFGIGGSLISQRPQEIAKKALNMSGTLFAFQMTGPQERKAIRAWVADQGVATDIEGVLQKLSVGEPHVESPTFLGVSKTVRILPRVTADLSSTPTVGGATSTKRPLTPIDVEQLRAQMAETIARAKADDPRELRRQVAERDRRIRELERAAAAPAGVDKAVLTDADRAQLQKLADELIQVRGKFDRLLDEAIERASAGVRAQLDALVAEIGPWREGVAARLETKRLQHIIEKLDGVAIAPATPHPDTTAATRTTSRPLPAASPRPTIPARKPAAGPGEAMPPGEKAVLTACAMYDDGVSRDQLGILTGYKRSSRDSYVARLVARGWVASFDGHVVATDVGIEALGGDYEPLPTGAALLEWWRQRLPAGECKVLDELVRAGGHSVRRDALDEATGFARSSRDSYLARLSARRLVVPAGAGLVAAAPALFD